jgi:hypothetical protein
VSISEAEARSEARKEAAPAALAAFIVLVALALASWARDWVILSLPWWVWLLVGLPALLLTVDLLLAVRGKGLVRSRRAALALLALLVFGNFVALAILVAALLTASTDDLGGGELLGTAFAIYSSNLVVFGLLYWEVESGGPGARRIEERRVALDFLFPQDDLQRRSSENWRPTVWDYLYLSTTNSIAFSPTDAMPLSLRAKGAMGLEAAISAALILLVAARAVNVLGS